MSDEFVCRAYNCFVWGNCIAPDSDDCHFQDMPVSGCPCRDCYDWRILHAGGTVA